MEQLRISNFVLEKMFKHNEYGKDTSSYNSSKSRKYTRLEKESLKK